MIDKEIIVNDLRIHYVQSANFSKESPVVFLHGWKSQASHLASLFSHAPNFIAPDLPGFGNSDLSSETWGVTEYAEFLRSFLRKLEIKNALLVGHSFGGAVILNYCAQGGQAQKAILIGSSGVRIKSLKKKIYKRIAKVGKAIFKLPGFSALRQLIRKNFYQAIGAEDYIDSGRLIENYKKIIGEDLRQDAAKIKVPVVLIWGENDDAAPLRYGKMMHELIPASILHIIPKAGHFCFIDNPEEFFKVFDEEISDE